MSEPEFPIACSGFIRSGPLRLDRVYGNWIGRFWSYISCAVPSEQVDSEAFVVTSRPSDDQDRGAVLHRVDMSRGAVLDSHDLGVTTAGVADIRRDGRRVALVGDGKLRVRTTAGEFVWKQRGGWDRARFVPGVDRLVASNAQGRIAEFDGSTGAELTRMNGFPPWTLSSDGRLLAVRPDREHLMVWDRVAGREVARWPGPPWRIALTTAGDLVCTRYVDRTTTELISLRAGQRGPRWCVRLADDRPISEALALREDRGTVLVHVGGTSNAEPAIHEHRLDDGALIGIHPVSPGVVTFSASGERAVLRSTSVFFGWDASTGQQHRTSVGHDAKIDAIACSPDGSLIGTSANDRTVRLWDSHTGDQVRVLPSGLADFPSLRFTEDSRLLLGAPRFGAEQHCWRVSDGSPATPPYRLPSRTSSDDVTLSGSGGYAASRTHGRVAVFDARDGARLGQAEPVTNMEPIFVGSRWLLVVDLDMRIHVYELPAVALRTSLSLASAQDAPHTVIACPDGNSLLVGTRRGVLLRFSFDDD